MNANPFGAYASRFSGLKFAAGESDLAADYVNDYYNSLWGNVFGGATLASIDGSDKKKTYAGLLIGGDVKVTEQFSINLGAGAKQLIANKVNGKDETYVSGQLGLKYKF